MSIDWDRPVQGRDGSEARVYTTIGQNPVYPVVGEIIGDEGTWIVYAWTFGGLVIAGKANAGDLVNVPQKHTLWHNINSDWKSGYTTRRSADRLAAKNRIACIEVTFTEGEGIADEH